METLPQTYKWYVGIQNNPFNEKYGYVEIRPRLLWKALVENRMVNDDTSALIHIPLCHRDKNTIGFAGVILVTIQCVIMIASIYPTEKALKKHFNDDGSARSDLQKDA